MTFGIVARIADVDPSFPTTSRTLIGKVGDPQIAYDAAGNEIASSELSRDRFETEAELLDHLHPVFELP